MDTLRALPRNFDLGNNELIAINNRVRWSWDATVTVVQMQVVANVLHISCALALEQLWASATLVRDGSGRHHVAERNRWLNRTVNRTNWKIFLVHQRLLQLNLCFKLK